MKTTANKRFASVAPPAPPRVGSFSEIEGNLLDLAKKGEFDIIAHGANCFSTMGAGIAKAVALEFPEVYSADKNYPLSPIERLGGFSSAGVRNPGYGDFRVFNFYTQYYPGPDFDIDALKVALRKFCIFHQDMRPKMGWRIGLPLIGCGIGGGKWAEVKAVFQKELHEFDVTIVHFPTPPVSKFTFKAQK